MNWRKYNKYFLFSIALFLYGCLFELNFMHSTSDNMEYRVQKGDTIYGIAQKFRVSFRGIIKANNLESPYIIYVNQKLTIPSLNQHIYIVKKGDNLGLIAKRHRLSVKKVIALNRLRSPYVIHPGQKLYLPPHTYSRRAATSSVSGNSQHIPAARTQPKPPPKRSGSYFQWPAKGKIIRKFGAYGKGLTNDGINILAPAGTPIVAAEHGVVVYAGDAIEAFGNLILIQHADGWVTAYGHSQHIFVKTGDQVKKGQKIASIGQTGNVNRPQLHFEIRNKKQALNPLKFLK